MSFLNKNVNFVLLILMIVLMVAFTGTTVYFQRSFQGMNDKYNTKVREVESLIVAVRGEQNRSAELHEAYLGCFNQTGEEQKGFNYVVSDLSKLKDNLNKSLMGTKSDLDSVRQKLSYTEGILEETENDLEEANDDLRKADDENLALKKTMEKYNRWASDTLEYSTALKNAIEDYISDDTTPASCDSILDDLKVKADSVDDAARKLEGLKDE